MSTKGIGVTEFVIKYMGFFPPKIAVTSMSDGKEEKKRMNLN